MGFIFVLVLLLTSLLFPIRASAHAFGMSYDLPIPIWLYQLGGAAVLILSFVVIALFMRVYSDERERLAELPKWKILKLSSNHLLVTFLKLTGVILLALTVWSGFVGVNAAYMNINMNLFWIWFLLGFTYLTAFAGNLWEVINPWKTLSIITTKIVEIKKGKLIEYPRKLGYYPALVFYMIFIWFELIGETTPYVLSLILLIYTFVSVFGALIFGGKAWFKYAEFTSVLFRLIAKLSPFEAKKRSIYLRPPFIVLITKPAESLSILIFILFMLSSTAFDGFLGTEGWYFLQRNVGIRLDISPEMFGTMGLVLSPFLFLAIFVFFMFISKMITGTNLTLNKLCLLFAFTHIPLVFVYNLAHYYTLFLVQGQDMIRLVSDPLGYGWDIFGTADYRINIDFLNAAVTWHFQVLIIVLGHILGVYLSHLLASMIFPNTKKAILSQIPMLALMATYTMIGLWILYQPLVV